MASAAADQNPILCAIYRPQQILTHATLFTCQNKRTYH